ncbi:conserved hypothetical protein [Beggiatoa sp. PS]|nr:conserved hypothetical protein [Beggiatoa sp. PS]
MILKQLTIFILAIFLVSGCSDNDDHAEYTASPFTATTEIHYATLAKMDDNANGIRDDIDKLIEQKFSYTPEVKRAAEQEARALQQFMEATTKENALKSAEQIARATSCTFKILNDPVRDYDKRQELSKELEAWTTNTKERLSKYLESSKLISGAYFMQPIEPVCD